MEHINSDVSTALVIPVSYYAHKSYRYDIFSHYLRFIYRGVFTFASVIEVCISDEHWCLLPALMSKLIKRALNGSKGVYFLTEIPLR